MYYKIDIMLGMISQSDNFLGIKQFATYVSTTYITHTLIKLIN